MYRHVNCVVMLDENMRHRYDPVWLQILQRWRLGEYLQSDVDVVNRICYKTNWGSTAASLETFCPIIVTSNTLRSEFNASSSRVFCLTNNQPLHQFPAIVSRPRFKISKVQRRAMQNLRDDKTGSIPITLSIAMGMPVQCSKNVSQLFKLANGTIGNVVSFLPDPADTVTTATKGGVEYHVHALPPLVVYVKLLGYDNTSFLPGFPPGVVPIKQRFEKGVEIKMPMRSFKVSIKQVPIVPAFALTSEKCQGLTVDKMILGPLRHPTRRSPQRSSFYVAVTRVKALQQLYLMEPLTIEFLRYFTPREDALAENRRLQAMDV